MQTQIRNTFSKITYSFDLCPLMDTELPTLQYKEPTKRIQPPPHLHSYWTPLELQNLKLHLTPIK